MELIGAEQIASPLDYLDLHYGRTMHFVGTHVIDLDGDTATGLVYCLAHHLSGEGSEQKVTVMAIRYEDSYIRTDAGWRFARRTMNPDWEEQRTALPVQPPLSDI